MKIKQITLGDDQLPESIVAELSIDEAIVLAKMTGKYSALVAGHDFGRRGKATASIYDALVESIFNPFWDDGVDDAARSPR